MALPEFLLGAPYDTFEYEGTLLTAFSMAVLQELNGRNVNNPISCLRGEVNYPNAGGKHADLHLDLLAVGVLTDRLSAYGIKRHNWLEAKYFRTNAQGRPTADKLTGTFGLAKDLLRLAALPPEPNPPSSIAGRYLLHAYTTNPANHLAARKNKADASPGFVRRWIELVREPGRRGLDGFRFDDEVGHFDLIVGNGLRQVDLDLTVTNFAYVPPEGAFGPSLCLTRLDKIALGLGGLSFTIDGTSLQESAPGAYAAVSAQIAGSFAV